MEMIILITWLSKLLKYIVNNDMNISNIIFEMVLFKYEIYFKEMSNGIFQQLSK